MRDDSDGGYVVVCEVERRRGAVAVARGGKPRYALRLECRDDLVEVLLPDIVAVPGEPSTNVKLPRRIKRVLRDRVAAQVVGDDGAVPIAREVVREELARGCQSIGIGRGSGRTLLLLRAIPKTSVRNRMTFVLS